MNLNRICICLLVVAAITVPALAAGNPYGRISSSVLSEPSFQGDEGSDYKAWYDANGAKDYEKAYELAKGFVAKYPSSANTDYLKKWIPPTRITLFNAAYSAKDVAKTLQYGNDAMAEDPNNVDFLYLMGVSIYNFEIASQNYAHSAQLVEFNNKIMSLVDSGKVPASLAKEFNKNTFSASLLQQNGVIALKNGENDKALEIFQKSASLDPKSSYNYRQIGTLIFGSKYKPAADKYGALPDKDPEKPEVKALLDEVNKQADAVIDSWAHYVAVEAKPEAQIKDGLEKLYKFRHQDSLDGLQKLIDQYKSGGAVNP